MVCQSQYCAFRQLAETLEISGTEWLIAMFHVFFDDSGTNQDSDIAIAACYISTTQGWRDFVTAWDDARAEEGFDVFHMTDFVAKREYKRKPFCDWDNTKKDHVYARLAKIINENKRIGIASAVPKKAYDAVPDRIRKRHGREHYTFAVRTCMTRIAKWRKASGITLPMQYVFDFEMENSQKRREIATIWKSIRQPWVEDFGMEPEGYGFEHRQIFKPLQAADILAWQMNNHMRKIMPIGHDDLSVTHNGFRMLRENQHMDLGFYTEDQLKKWVNDIEQVEAEHGKAFWE